MTKSIRLNSPSNNFLDNPFATRFTKPGRIPYLFAHDTCLAKVVENLKSLGFRGQVIGPHGSGKSTFLHSIIHEMRKLSVDVRFVRIEPKSKEARWKNVSSSQTPSDISFNGYRGAKMRVLIIDGFEQLALLQRRLAIGWTRKNKVGLVVTAHRNVGLKTVLKTRNDLSTLERVVEWLQKHNNNRMPSELIKTSFEAADQNIRETLFLLYDRFRDSHTC